jgi:hypothetical protein
MYMKTKVLSIISAMFIASVLNVARADEHIPHRGCGSMEYKAWEEKNNPAIAVERAKIEQEIQEYLKQQLLNPNRSPRAVITIPVVFHVVYNVAAANVSDLCLQKTLDAFNKDYRKLNTDFSAQCPSVFQSLAADCEIQFCFASKDPSGNPTNGITRTQTSTATFSTNNAVKYTAQGGHDAWDRNKFINFWICDLGSSLLGYGQFPGGTAATDGVVCHYKYLHKDGGCGAGNYNLGRTTVHELGHFFNLQHIWGDANCGDDQVSDTPTQQTSNYGKPTFPHVTCSNGPNGDMFMNYMDYVDDASMVMFSAGQKARIIAALNTSTRSGLKTSGATYCVSTGMNDYVLYSNVTIYPNPSTGDVFLNLDNANVTSADIVIYNTVGEAVLQKKISVPTSGKEIKLNMGDKPEGVYLFRMNTPQGSVTKKVVINK